MQAELMPTLEIRPFDHQFGVKAQVEVQPQHRKDYVYRSFLMLVIELRSAMTEHCITMLKESILSMCEDMLERDGIDNIGFVINEEYYTIRNPNYEGIKDLLTSNLKLEDTTDIKNTLQTLRHSIMKESKKMKECKLSLFFFSSNVAENKLSPIKESYRVKLNTRKDNYYDEIKKLGTTVREFCIDSRFYTICYANLEECAETKEKDYGWIYCGNEEGRGYFDVCLIYRIANCTNNQKAFHFCTSFNQLKKDFESVTSLMTYEFHEFSLMVPLRTEYRNSLLGEDKEKLQQEEVVKQKMEEESDEQEDDEEYEEFKAERSEKQQKQKEEKDEEDIFYTKIRVVNENELQFKSPGWTFFDKNELNLNALKEKGYHLVKYFKKGKEREFPKKKKVIRHIQSHFEPFMTSQNVNYHEPTLQQLIECRVQCYKQQLQKVMGRLQRDIIHTKIIYLGNSKYWVETKFDTQLQFKLREKAEFIDKMGREVYEMIFKSEELRNQKQQRAMFELYSSLKLMIDVTQEVIMKTLKKQIGDSEIGNLSNAINYDKIKSSLRRKLIKRVNSNPKLIDDTYDRVQQICEEEIVDFVDLQAKNRYAKSQVGNCMYSYKNFATALRDRDCLALVFEIERPDSAIADPGRIKIRQISTMVVSVAKFFQIHFYKIPTSYESSLMMRNKQLQKQNNKYFERLDKTFCPICWCICGFQIFKNIGQETTNMLKMSEEERKVKNMREKDFGINSKAYQQRWDYWDKVEKRKTVLGIMPLFVCEENWKVAKLYMKLCLGWTACGQPLGYSYSQFQTIPFMVLSTIIKSAQQVKYKISQLQKQAFNAYKDTDHFQFRHQINLQKHILARYENLIKHTEATCNAIMRDMSLPHLEQPLNQKVIQKYQDYQNPLRRTVDVINNNSSFMGQLYTVIQTGMMKKPIEKDFHEFFKRLIEEELRRQTERWNEDPYSKMIQTQEEQQESFVNKLLNAHIESMDKPQYVVLDSHFRRLFEEAVQGQQIFRTEFQIQRDNLAMMLKEGNTFNPTQRMLIIEYKRLYENRVLWFWYIRFRLYQEQERVSIHKWKCLDLTNSYQLFTMIIQNKRQRRNYRRREAIQQNLYADPFNYYEARTYLEEEYVKIRNKKESQNIVLLNTQKYTKAASVFAMTPDLDEAAGALMNVQIGRQIHFFYMECKRGGRMLEQKLKMLLKGEHKGVRLLKHGWMMSRKRMNEMRKEYPLIFMRYQYMF